MPLIVFPVPSSEDDPSPNSFLSMIRALFLILLGFLIVISVWSAYSIGYVHGAVAAKKPENRPELLTVLPASYLDKTNYDALGKVSEDSEAVSLLKEVRTYQKIYYIDLSKDIAPLREFQEHKKNQ